jgi:hypothetical protein
VRNDIQAPRAIALLMVVANHLFPDRVGGGYVGVAAVYGLNWRFASQSLNHLICRSVVGGLPVTRDGQHITSFLAQSFGNAFLEKELPQVLAATSGRERVTRTTAAITTRRAVAAPLR